MAPYKAVWKRNALEDVVHYFKGGFFFGIQGFALKGMAVSVGTIFLSDSYRQKNGTHKIPSTPA